MWLHDILYLEAGMGINQFYDSEAGKQVRSQAMCCSLFQSPAMVACVKFSSNLPLLVKPSHLPLRACDGLFDALLGIVGWGYERGTGGSPAV
jgi:hypothetical protein